MVLKFLFAVVVLLHGLIHLLGFIKEWKIAEVSQLSGKTIVSLSKNTSRLLGIFWLITTLIMLVSAIGFLFNREWWWMAAIPGLAISQLLIILYWPDAKAGTIANLIILIAVILGYARWDFSSLVRSEGSQILSQIQFNGEQKVTEADVQELPYPVRNWLHRNGSVGNPLIHSVRLRQHGMMRTEPGKENWMEVVAVQYFTADPPAFIWTARVQVMPFISISGRDKFENGRGNMLIKPLSVITIADAADDKTDQGTLQRYLAETVWFPSAVLLPYIHWEEIDSTTARAVMTYRGTTGSGIFQFNTQGEFLQFSTDRYMGNGPEATLEKWAITTIESKAMNGINIPVKIEATWKLKSGDYTWLKIEITEIEYNIPELF